MTKQSECNPQDKEVSRGGEDCEVLQSCLQLLRGDGLGHLLHSLCCEAPAQCYAGSSVPLCTALWLWECSFQP